MNTEYFALIEAIAGSFLAILLGWKYVQHKKIHHFMWMIFLILWSAFELGLFLQFTYGLTPIAEKIVSLLHMPMMAFSGVGMLFLFRGYELFPKIRVKGSWSKYFLVYILIVYSVLIGMFLIVDMRQAAIIASWALLVIPGAFITVSGSVSSFFHGRKRNILIAIGMLLAVIAEQYPPLFQIGLDTVGEVLMGIGLFITLEPQKAG